MIASTFAFPMTQAAAGMLATGKVMHGVSARHATVSAFLQRKDIQTKLVSLGVTPHEAAERMASLSDAEIKSLSEKIESLPAGQDAGIYIGTSTLIIILLLILLLK